MIQRIKISSTTHTELFEDCWALYTSAFPATERRDRDYQDECFEQERYNFEALFEETTHIGFIAWWRLESFTYIEHFAIFDTLRGAGYGGRVLKGFIAQCHGDILLEVEHPEDSLKERRINFYKSLGFKLNTHRYAQPPYRGHEYLDLLVMTYPEAISRETLESFTSRELPMVHFRLSK